MNMQETPQTLANKESLDSIDFKPSPKLDSIGNPLF